ncbi:MAG: FtsH protease activity modulator HflK [bacterium]|nr:FtsH protease activity modulator HflK [bacterium]
MEHSIRSEIGRSLRGTGRFARWVALCLLGIYLLSGVYSISPNETGVLQRFGRVLEADISPGIHWAFPWPVDRVSRVPVRESRRVSVDDFFEGGEHAEPFRRLTGLAPACVTGDNNIVTVNCAIQYLISDPAAYLFGVARVEEAFHDLAAAAVLHCIARMPVDEILTYGKTRIERFIKEHLQERLDAIGAGIAVSFVELRDVRAPRAVQSYFDDVINSKIDKRNRVATAESYRNEQIPHAHARADRTVQEARAHAQRAVAEAEGNASRFLSQLEEYQKDPDTTRRRLFLEFAARIHPRLEGTIVVEEGGQPVRLLQRQSPAIPRRPAPARPASRWRN